MKITEHCVCRACGCQFYENVLLDLGEQEIVDFPLPGEKTRGKAPLTLVMCSRCNLVQLRHSVDDDTLFRKFWYRSSLNEQMRQALKDVVDGALKKVGPLKEDDVVVDIGCNDGELLTNYPQNLIRVGFEPALELVQQAAYHGVGKTVFYNDYFKEGYLAPDSCRIITAIAMFYDLNDPVTFLKEVVRAMHPDGIFVVQMNYLGLMLKNMTFDNISHEHNCYYSLHALERLFHSVGLVITDVEQNEVNGGSVRVYASKNPEASVGSSVEWMMAVDTRACSSLALEHFCEMVRTVGPLFVHFLKHLRAAGKKVYAYGASTRGMSLLQTVFGNIPAKDYIIAVAERDENKYGRLMAGLNIPIIPEEEARKKADYFLLLPYHFWNSIRERERNWMLSGGKFIIPLPFPKVMEMSVIDENQKIPMAVALDEEMDRIPV